MDFHVFIYTDIFFPCQKKKFFSRNFVSLKITMISPFGSPTLQRYPVTHIIEKFAMERTYVDKIP